ncbi:MAG: FMN-binding protein [Clostridia bacterium]|nr:FMN-binding protein [Clostridia bacterium]
MKVKKVSAKPAEKSIYEKIISYGPLLPCLAVAVLVTSGLSGYRAPAAAMGNTSQNTAVSASAGTAGDVSGSTTAAIQRSTTVSRSNPVRTNATAAAGAQKSLGSVSESGTWKDGTYTGTATGFVGPITVRVTVSGGKITAITVTNSTDNEPYLTNAKGVIQKILNGQTTNVDVVSGATYSSNGIIGAVRNALAKAAVSGSANAAQGSGSSATAPSTTTTTRKPVSAGQAGQFPYPDGTYEGEGEGRNDIIRLAVTLKDGSITDISVLEHYEDEEPYFRNARQLLEDVKTAQSLNVDTVSGATLSSNGLLEALNDALGKAKAAGSAASSTEPESTTRTSPQEESTTTTTDATSSAQPENPATAEGTVYRNGEYFVSVTCEPDEDEDFDPYTLTLKVTIRADKITNITDVSGDGASSNQSYINKAVNGTSKKAGVVSQITAKGDPAGIDAVSGATCTSDAIVKACEDALAQARVV